MPLGWECRAKLIKQNPIKPTVRRASVSCAVQNPGPNRYETPEIFCGKGYSHIKRAPAFTFGYQTPFTQSKAPISSSAPMLDTGGMGPKGLYKVKHGVISPRIVPVQDKVTLPGPGLYNPRSNIRYKNAAAYTMRPAARPPYQPWDQWTPSPNMYLPRLPGKKSSPAYSFGSVLNEFNTQTNPSPGAHNPNFEFVRKSKPAYSFGGPFRVSKPSKSPAPNTYCEKKFMYSKRSIPASSFGIRHTPFLGKAHEYLKPSNLDVVNS